MSIFRSSLLVAGIGATLAAAQGKVTQCPISNVCYALSIPPSTASSGTGDIYMQISAPTSYQWVALGQGTQMAGANMFIMYASASGNNVTVSPRRASGEVMPRYVSDTQLTVLQGSGISNGQMVANIKCGNCASWSGGSMNLQTGNSNWIFSYRTGSALNTDSQSQSLVQHDNYGFITWDVTQARASSAANPFITADGTTSATNSSSNGDANSGSSSTGGGSSDTDMYITVHGSLSTVAFVALYPIGALVIRFASFKGTIWAHAGIQALAYMIQIAGAGIGIWLAITLSELDSYHAIIGLILLGIVFFQPFLGWFHHKVYQRTKARGVHSYAHILIGRAAILLGIINGGFGLQLAGAEQSEYIAYGVCAGVVGVAYIAAFMFGEVRRSKVQRNGSPHSSIGESKNNAA